LHKLIFSLQMYAQSNQSGPIGQADSDETW